MNTFEQVEMQAVTVLSMYRAEAYCHPCTDGVKIAMQAMARRLRERPVAVDAGLNAAA